MDKDLKNGNGEPIPVAIYTRKSVADDERKEFGSIEAQRQACEAYVKAHPEQHWALLDEHFDDYGWSGKNLERPAFTRLMQLCREGKVKHIVAWRIDRLSRNVKDFSIMVDLLRELGVGFSSVMENIDAESPTGRLLIQIMVGMAQCERETAISRVKSFFDQSRAAGRFLGGKAPYGYKSEKCHLVVDPAVAPKVVEIFRTFVELGGATKKVAAAVTAKGILRADGTPWNMRSINTVISCPRYIGMAYNSEHELIEGDQEPIVPRELWDQANKLSKVLRGAGQRGKPATLESGLLNGIARCGHCGGALGYHYSSHVNSDKATRRRYGSYVCITDRRRAVSGLCPVKHVSSDILENLVQRKLEEVLAGSLLLADAAAKKAGVPPADLVGWLHEPGRLWTELPPAARRELVRTACARVVVFESNVDLELNLKAFGISHEDANLGGGATLREDGASVVHMPVQFTKVSQRRKIVDRESPAPAAATANGNPILQALVRAREWMGIVDDGVVKSTRDLSRLLGVDRSRVRKILRLNFLSPRIVRCVLNGTEPNGLTLNRLFAINTSNWAEQERILGIAR